MKININVLLLCLASINAPLNSMHKEIFPIIELYDSQRDSSAVDILLETFIAEQQIEIGRPQLSNPENFFKNLFKNESQNTERYNSNYCCKILRLGEKIIGFTCLAAHKAKNEVTGKGSILLLVINPDNTGRGYEHQLLNDAVTHFQSMPISKISTSENSFNINPLILTQLGFYTKKHNNLLIYKLQLLSNIKK